MPPAVRLAVVGAGLIGQRHIQHILAEPGTALAAIVDPAAAAPALAARAGAPWFASIADMLAATPAPDGAIIATPNQLHVEHGLACIAAGIAMLVEKPIADDVAAATRLVAAAEAAGLPLLVGHHRRHNPLITAARQAIADGRLGRITAVHGTCWLAKPAEYFEVPWRRAEGAGPILINLIHDIDLLRHLCGDIVSVQAFASNAMRGHEVEETAVILMRFAGGALGTLTVSDTTVAPWSWEFTSGENPAYTHTAETCYMIGGTQGALAIPNLDLWHHEARPDWFTPLQRVRLPAVRLDPLVLQIRNFCAVIRGEAAPVVSGRDGLDTLRVIAAIQRAIASGGAATSE